MDSVKLLERILAKFKEQGYAQVPGYNRFGFIRETASAVIVSRETGKDTSISFSKIVQGIEAVQDSHRVYDELGLLRKYGVSHVNSPIWALLHLLPKSEY